MLQALKLSMIFLNESDLMNLSLCCKRLNYDAKDEMRHRRRKLAQQAFECIEKNNSLILAGSMALWLKQGSPTTWFPNDADLFWYGTPETDGEIKVTFKVENKDRNVSFLYHYKKPYVETIETRAGKLQFVMTSFFKTEEDVLKTFDLSCCQIAAKDPKTFLTLDPAFDPTSFYWFCPSFEEVKSHGKDEDDDLLALLKFHRLRSLRRAAKYERRQLKNLGVKPGTIDLLKFSIMYKRQSSIIYQNNLVPRLISDERYMSFCTCDNEWCNFCLESSAMSHVEVISQSL